MHRISRRIFLLWSAAVSGGGWLVNLLPASGWAQPRTNSDTQEAKMGTDLKIGLALGAGGANGLAHISMLEVFDELGIKPVKIAGSSIGSIFGAMYSSGLGSGEIKAIVDELVVRKHDSWKDVFLNKKILQWVDFLDPEIGKGGFISGDAFLAFLFEHIQVRTFEELTIPMAVVATDFWEREQVVFDSGDLLSAIQGSMALPGLFTPVRRSDRVLIDGGAVNPVPYDILIDACDMTVAVDVSGKRSPKKDLSFLDAFFNTFQIMQHSIMAGKIALQRPDILVSPDIVDIRTLEFHRVDDIFKQAREAKDRLKRDLEARLG